VEFLGVVIGPGGVRMQKEKVDGVLSWPTQGAPRMCRSLWDSPTTIGGSLSGSKRVGQYKAAALTLRSMVKRTQ